MIMRPSETSREFANDGSVRRIRRPHRGEGCIEKLLEDADMSDGTPLPFYETARLTLRGVTEKDIPEWRQHLSDYEVAAHLVTDSLFFTLNPFFLFKGRVCGYGVFLSNLSWINLLA